MKSKYLIFFALLLFASACQVKTGGSSSPSSSGGATPPAKVKSYTYGCSIQMPSYSELAYFFRDNPNDYKKVLTNLNQKGWTINDSTSPEQFQIITKDVSYGPRAPRVCDGWSSREYYCTQTMILRSLLDSKHDITYYKDSLFSYRCGRGDEPSNYACSYVMSNFSIKLESSFFAECPYIEKN